MPSFRQFNIVNGANQPNAAAAPSFVKYCDRSNTPRTQPAILNLGGGLYAFLSTDADDQVGTVAVIDRGVGNQEQYLTRALYLPNNSNQFWAWHLEFAGITALWTGAPATIGKYTSPAGDRTAPAVNVIETYLFTLTPSYDDVVANIAVRMDSPTGAFPGTQSANSDAFNAPYQRAVATPGLNAERISIKSLREYLLQHLPAKCQELNLQRAAVLRSTGIGPVEVTAGMKLIVSRLREGGDLGTDVFEIPLTIGAVRTWAQIANDFNAVSGTDMTASVDGMGYFCITDDTTPDYDWSDPHNPTLSCVCVRPEETAGVHALFGWDPGGEYVVCAPVVPPQYRGVADGWPHSPPDYGQGFWIILDDRSTVPYQGKSWRYGEYVTTIATKVLRPEINQIGQRDREAISACCRAILEVLNTDAGRYLSRGGVDVMGVETLPADISGTPIEFLQGSPFDIASLTIAVRTYQRPQTN